MEGAVENWSPRLSPNSFPQTHLVAAAWIFCFIMAALALGWSELQ
jgi:hypothetical protein